MAHSAETKEQAHTLRAQGHTCKEISTRTGVSEYTVFQWISKDPNYQRKTKGTKGAPRQVQAVEMRLAGKGPMEISKALGVPLQTLHNWFRGMPRLARVTESTAGAIDRRDLTADRAKAARVLYAAGFTVAAISRILAFYPYGTVQSWVHQPGEPTPDWKVRARELRRQGFSAKTISAELGQPITTVHLATRSAT